MARKIAYRKKRQNRTGMLLVTMVVLMMLVVVTVKSVELRGKKEAYEQKEMALQEEIDAEKIRTEEIAEYGKYTRRLRSFRLLFGNGKERHRSQRLLRTVRSAAQRSGSMRNCRK